MKKIPYPNDARLGPGVLMIGPKTMPRLYYLGAERMKVVDTKTEIPEIRTFYGYDTIGPRVYALYRPIYQVGPKPKTYRERAKEIMRLAHDANCPECDFPETIFVHEVLNRRGNRFDLGDFFEERCSKSCGWSRKIKPRRKAKSV